MHNKSTSAISGLYAITHHDHLSDSKMLSEIEAVILGGANIVQFRDKTSDSQKRKQRSLALHKLCKRLSTLLIINDDIELCHSIKADGVHLGAQDSSIQYARSQLGDGAIIGATCHDSVALALTAQTQGANYIALGRFFPSKSKAQAKPATISCIRQIKQQLQASHTNLPIVAIGGITLDNAPTLIEHGADSIAIINDLYCQQNIQEHAQQLSQLFD